MDEKEKMNIHFAYADRISPCQYTYISIFEHPYSILNSPLDDIPFNILAHHIHLYKFDTKFVNRCS